MQIWYILQKTEILLLMETKKKYIRFWIISCVMLSNLQKDYSVSYNYHNKEI